MRNSQRAFTLMEVMVAAFIIAVGFLAVARILPSSKRGGVVDRNRLIALRLARGTLDAVRSKPFLDTASYNKLVGPVSFTGESVEANQVNSQFAITSVTAQPATAPVPPAGGITPLGFANVTVTVEWHEGVGKNSSDKASAGNNSLTMTGGVSREP